MTESMAQPRLHSETLVIRGYLTFAARHHQFVSADQIAAGTGVVKSRIPQRVNELNRSELAEGRPILGALVATGEPPRPTSGFLTLAREIAGTDDLHAFWRSQCESAWAYGWDA